MHLHYEATRGINTTSFDGKVTPKGPARACRLSDQKQVWLCVLSRTVTVQEEDPLYCFDSWGFMNCSKSVVFTDLLSMRSSTIPRGIAMIAMTATLVQAICWTQRSRSVRLCKRKTWKLLLAPRYCRLTSLSSAACCLKYSHDLACEAQLYWLSFSAGVTCTPQANLSQRAISATSKSVCC